MRIFRGSNLEESYKEFFSKSEIKLKLNVAHFSQRARKKILYDPTKKTISARSVNILVLQH